MNGLVLPDPNGSTLCIIGVGESARCGFDEAREEPEPHPQDCPTNEHG